MINAVGSVGAKQEKGKMQFRFFKNQEIPEFHYDLDTDKYLTKASNRALEEDFVDFNVNLVDNGDEKLCL
jgi:hypothetical protein